MVCASGHSAWAWGELALGVEVGNFLCLKGIPQLLFKNRILKAYFIFGSAGSSLLHGLIVVASLVAKYGI